MYSTSINTANHFSKLYQFTLAPVVLWKFELPHISTISWYLLPFSLQTFLWHIIVTITVLVCISLMTNWVNHPFLCSLAIGYTLLRSTSWNFFFFFQNCCSGLPVFPYFLIGFCFFVSGIFLVWLFIGCMYYKYLFSYILYLLFISFF